MTYCLGIATRFGLVMASDSRTNAGFDQVNICQKMYTFVTPGERVFVLLASGSLSCTQSVMTLLRRDFDLGRGLAVAPTLYDAARVIGEQVRKVADLDRAALERDEYKFNVNLVLGGQVKGEPHGLFLIYPQGNPLQATLDSPFLQIGESKYGRPILDRGIRYEHTTLEEAAKYALLSLDSTMKSNVTVGPPIDLLVYPTGELDVTRQRRFADNDPDLIKIRTRWQQALRQAVARLPNIKLKPRGAAGQKDESIQLVEGAADAPGNGAGDREPAPGQATQNAPPRTPA
jgi:putative proteasome-type protease